MEEYREENQATEETANAEENANQTVCAFCGRVIDVKTESVYFDKVTEKVACLQCDKKLRKQYRQAYFENSNKKIGVGEMISAGVGTVLFLAVGISGLIIGALLLGVVCTLAGIGYGVWLAVMIKRKKKEKAEDHLNT